MKRFPSSTDARIDVELGPVVDCHQHLWPEAFAEALRQRNTSPRLRGWRLELPGEPVYDVNPADHDRPARRTIDDGDGVDLTLLSLPAPLGVETLPPEEAHPLLTAWHSFADQLFPGEGGDASGFAIWASPALTEPEPDRLARLLAHPAVCGLQVPATELSTPAAIERLAPVLAVAEASDRPVLVHPGPAPPLDRVDLAYPVPGWWPALTSYLAQLAVAWFAWQVAGRALLPTLRIGFVALAGLAPLHHERLAQRGGTLGAIDPLVFYETSSYGTRAVDAMVRVVGVDALVHGSDRPYAVPTDPGLGAAFGRALFVTNPARLLKGAAT